MPKFINTKKTALTMHCKQCGTELDVDIDMHVEKVFVHTCDCVKNCANCKHLHKGIYSAECLINHKKITAYKICDL